MTRECIEGCCVSGAMPAAFFLYSEVD